MLSPSAACFLLFGLQILALWVPPFRGRALVFVSAIITCAILLHTDRVSDDPQIAYAFGMAWPSYLATIDRLLFTKPELSFWRAGDKRGEASSYGFGLKKLSWSAGQIVNPRGIHWNYQVKGITSTEGKSEFRSRKAFLYRHTATFVKLCLGYDLLHSYLVSQHRHAGSIDGDYTPLGDRPFAWSFATTAAAAYVMFCGIQLNHLVTSITFVGLGLSRPEDWPPLYGSVQDAFTVRRVWGCFWHKLIRRVLHPPPCTILIAILGIKDKTTGAVVHLFTVFTISGIFHALPLRVMLVTEHWLPLGTVFFFFSQAVAILFEEAVMEIYTRAAGGSIEPRSWHRLVGFAWVTAWLYWSLPFFLDDMFASGMMDASTIPFSVARAVARSFGFVLKDSYPTPAQRQLNVWGVPMLSPMIFPASTFVHLRTAQRVISRGSRPQINHLPSTTAQIQCRHFISQFFRSTKPKTLSTTGSPGTKGLGEKVLIYYAGQRIVFVATLKLATLFVAGFCAFIAAPSVGINTEYGYWAPVGIIIAGAVPLVFMQYTSPPYVTHAYLHLPPWARQSQGMMARYAQKLPPSAQLSLGTIRILGRPQLQTVILSELTYKPKRLGCANWEWKPPFEDKKIFRDFYLDQRGSPAKVPAVGIIDEVIKLVQEQTRESLTGKKNIERL